MLRILQSSVAGSGVEVYPGWNSVDSGISDETWAVAPQSGWRQPNLLYEEGKAGLRITKPSGIFHIVYSRSEIQQESEMRKRLDQIDSARQWNIISTTIDALGIPSFYYPPGQDVWYITTVR
jgi:hypothetical protein